MTAGVLSGRVVTAACVAAGQADAKMQPFPAVAQALLATLDPGGSSVTSIVSRCRQDSESALTT